MRVDLDEPLEGDGEPDDLPVRAAAIIVGLGAVLGGALFLSGFGEETKRVAVERPIVLVSGRDDHGLLVQKTVGLSRFVGGETTTRVPDGTLVRVEATHGDWLQVRSLERTAARGWVNDFYLRGTVHLAGGKGGRQVGSFPFSAQVAVLEVKAGRVRVRSLDGKREGWVPRPTVTELPAR